MLSAATIDLTFDDDDWTTPFKPKLYRDSSVGSWGVTSMGRGFDWSTPNDDTSKPSTVTDSPRPNLTLIAQPVHDLELSVKIEEQKLAQSLCKINAPTARSNSATTISTIVMPFAAPAPVTATELVASPFSSRPVSPRTVQPPNRSASASSFRQSGHARSPRSPHSPHSRRRSSQQRVSLIAGRVSIAPIETPPSPPPVPHSLSRAPSTSTTAASTRAPSPSDNKETFLGGRSISEFVIEGEIGRGAYGLVKRGREIRGDGSLGPPLVIKQVIKSRILADCWKKHPKHGTIPIEIYVMSAMSNTPYILPARRPWDPRRLDPSADEGDWIPGKVVQGHPNICPLVDFFEDNHYYYLVLPSSTPEHQPDEPPPASDLFDLVENYPQGLPPNVIRSYLGQIADALCFLHSQGIVHRDVKDENVVLGPKGTCILIDFGSSGLVKKGGWDTFSGTLDYAGPEILRGERYHGKEQDVWAFGVVAYVLLVGECPFMTAAETQDGLSSPFANPSISLDERCAEGKETEGLEADGGGALGDAAALVRACLHVDVSARPTFEKILQCRFLVGNGGW
ncbi:kinase-like protein [Pluteus cervinus]|uniref:Kinase-like protein n=1 Tax=Pluteus cervinus TaxID=181527 RepID=A0ACD3BG04_9AGAR|nr:kinase-like protein [Pluteus cervinus]